MARKYSGKKRRSNKIEPAVMTLTVATPGSGSARSYIDLSQVASLVNRRFYRQGINWAVGGFKFSSLKAGTVNVYKLPNTWVLSNAWEKSFRVWRHMIREATDDSGAESVQGRFLDFKVFADAQHHLAGSAANLLPVDSGGAAFAPGQWQMSDVTIPTTGTGAAVDFELIAVGPNDPGPGASGKDAKSLIQGYADSRALPSPEDPNVPADANTNWMLNIFDEGTSQDAAVVNMLEVTGDNPPYPFEGDKAGTPDTMYPGGETQAPNLEWHDFVTIYEANATNGIGIQRGKGGNFPCGLICIDWTPAEAANLVIQIDLVPGTHRGYLCESMTEM
jgi:hypothetical protein